MHLIKRLIAKLYSVKSRWSSTVASLADPAEEARRLRYIRRERFIITDLIAAWLTASQQFHILDGGARSAFDDPRWNAFDPGRVRLYGFEVDEKECTDLNRLARERGLDYHYFPVGLWSQPTRITFYENKSPGGGSFFPQNTAFTNRWKFENTEQKFFARDMFYPTGTAEWDLTSVEVWASNNGVDDLDFLKLNVQGAELEILKGMGGLLDGVIGIQTEISFVESYRDRPFFADIDAFLRQHHFMFFDLIGHHCLGRAGSPITARHAPGLYPLFGQLMEGHGVYFKDPIDMVHRGIDIRHLSLPKLLKLVCFAEVYGQIEYAFELLYWLGERLRQEGDHVHAGQVVAIADKALATYRAYTGG